MQISLISPYPSILNLGLRTISAVLRQAGHNTQMILKKNQSPKLRFKSIDQIKNELFWVKNNLPFVSNILIEDDSFIDRRPKGYSLYSSTLLLKGQREDFFTRFGNMEDIIQWVQNESIHIS